MEKVLLPQISTIQASHQKNALTSQRHKEQLIEEEVFEKDYQQQREKGVVPAKVRVDQGSLKDQESNDRDSNQAASTRDEHIAQQLEPRAACENKASMNDLIASDRQGQQTAGAVRQVVARKSNLQNGGMREDAQQYTSNCGVTEASSNQRVEKRKSQLLLQQERERRYSQHAQKQSMHRQTHSVNSCANTTNEYLAPYNMENMQYLLRKIERDTTLVYDCYCNIKYVFRENVPHEYRRKLLEFIDRMRTAAPKSAAFRIASPHTSKRKTSRDNSGSPSPYRASNKGQLHHKRALETELCGGGSAAKRVPVNNDEQQLINASNTGNSIFTPTRAYPCLQELRVELESDAIFFDSRFESGNLRRVYKVAPHEYNLVLDFDAATDHYTQWYLFRVGNFAKGTRVKFNIVNMYKDKSLYEKGMRASVFSERHYEATREGWQRGGDYFTYARNEALKKYNPFPAHVVQQNMTGASPATIAMDLAQKRGTAGNVYNSGSSGNSKTSGAQTSAMAGAAGVAPQPASQSSQGGVPVKQSQLYYYTLTFVYTFKYAQDIVYFAHSQPYTYTDLQHYLNGIRKKYRDLAQVSALTRTTADNKIFAVTITEDLEEELKHNFKESVVVTARVHPGETNASFVAQGLIDFLLSRDDSHAKRLRQRFVFRIFPMLNPDGVRYGSYRCDLSGFDLNRCWRRTHPIAHAPIYAVKQLLTPLVAQADTFTRGVYLYCDIHGHSKSQDIFMYGNSFKEDEFLTLEQREKNHTAKMFPFLFHQRQRFFNFSKSSFAMQKDKLGTARVVCFVELGIVRSYTLECSFHGYRARKDSSSEVAATGQEVQELSANDFEVVGREFLRTLYVLSCKDEVQKILFELFNSKAASMTILGLIKEFWSKVGPEKIAAGGLKTLSTHPAQQNGHKNGAANNTAATNEMSDSDLETFDAADDRQIVQAQKKSLSQVQKSGNGSRWQHKTSGAQSQNRFIDAQTLLRGHQITVSTVGNTPPYQEDHKLLQQLEARGSATHDQGVATDINLQRTIAEEEQEDDEHRQAYAVWNDNLQENSSALATNIIRLQPLPEHVLSAHNSARTYKFSSESRRRTANNTNNTTTNNTNNNNNSHILRVNSSKVMQNGARQTETPQSLKTDPFVLPPVSQNNSQILTQTQVKTQNKWQMELQRQEALIDSALEQSPRAHYAYRPSSLPLEDMQGAHIEILHSHHKHNVLLPSKSHDNEDGEHSLQQILRQLAEKRQSAAGVGAVAAGISNTLTTSKQLSGTSTAANSAMRTTKPQPPATAKQILFDEQMGIMANAQNNQLLNALAQPPAQNLLNNVTNYSIKNTYQLASLAVSHAPDTFSQQLRGKITSANSGKNKLQQLQQQQNRNLAQKIALQSVRRDHLVLAKTPDVSLERFSSACQNEDTHLYVQGLQNGNLPAIKQLHLGNTGAVAAQQARALLQASHSNKAVTVGNHKILSASPPLQLTPLISAAAQACTNLVHQRKLEPVAVGQQRHQSPLLVNNNTPPQSDNILSKFREADISQILVKGGSIV